MSGVALKRVMQRMLAKAGGLAESFDKGIKRAFSVAAQLENVKLSDYEINWKDGIFDDVSERVTAAQQAGISQSMSLRTAVGYVQQIEGKTLDDEVAAIENERKAKTVLPLSDLYPDEDAEDETENITNSTKERLNGIQVTSIVNIATRVKEGSLSKNSAIALLNTSFGIDENEAKSILD